VAWPPRSTDAACRRIIEAVRLWAMTLPPRFDLTPAAIDALTKKLAAH